MHCGEGRTGFWLERPATGPLMRAGVEKAPPPGMGSGAHPPLDDAPGRYVLEK